MSRSYALVLERGQQKGQEPSFVGGKPRLPADTTLPDCSLCGAPETFYFQVAFPEDHAWGGNTLAVFACTSCADDNHLIPEMISGSLRNADIPAGFLAHYQRNFRFLVFPTGHGQLRSNYPERVLFRPIKLVPGTASAFGRLGGQPTWLLDDEAPAKITPGGAAVFLLEIGPEVAFATVTGAPSQMEIGLMGTPEASPDDFYRLFIGNATYLFGPPTPAPDVVYALTQVD